jgi:hypothetical protein
MEAKCYRAMRRDGQRHSPRRIAKHPELSRLLPLPACKMMSSELGLVCLDNLHGRDAYEEKRKIDRKDYQIILGYYRNNDYIVTGKRLHEAMPAWFCKTRILHLFI